MKKAARRRLAVSLVCSAGDVFRLGYPQLNKMVIYFDQFLFKFLADRNLWDIPFGTEFYPIAPFAEIMYIYYFVHLPDANLLYINHTGLVHQWPVLVKAPD